MIRLVVFICNCVGFCVSSIETLSTLRFFLNRVPIDIFLEVYNLHALFFRAVTSSLLASVWGVLRRVLVWDIDV